MQASSGRTGQEGSQVNVGQMERLASVIAGATILTSMGGLRSLRGAAATTIGSGLIWRGLTGHSALYHRLGIDTAEQVSFAAAERMEA